VIQAQDQAKAEGARVNKIHPLPKTDIPLCAAERTVATEAYAIVKHEVQSVPYDHVKCFKSTEWYNKIIDGMASLRDDAQKAGALFNCGRMLP
jgi:hypothetical protein